MFLIFIIILILYYLYTVIKSWVAKWSHKCNCNRWDNMSMLELTAIIENMIIESHREKLIKSEKIVSASEYATTGGKHIRGIIVFIIARSLSEHMNDTITSAILSVEYLHNASLVIDDHPDFDNDTMRRGRETTHKKFGPMISQLTALNLVIMGLYHLHKIGGYDIIDIYKKILIDACEGQYLDSITNITDTDISELRSYKKTHAFFQYACVLGMMCVIKNRATVDKLMPTIMEIGKLLGDAYQIMDDCNDYEDDKKRNKWNYVNHYGMDRAKSVMTFNIIRSKELINNIAVNKLPNLDSLIKSIYDIDKQKDKIEEQR